MLQCKEGKHLSQAEFASSSAAMAHCGSPLYHFDGRCKFVDWRRDGGAGPSCFSLPLFFCINLLCGCSNLRGCCPFPLVGGPPSIHPVCTLKVSQGSTDVYTSIHSEMAGNTPWAGHRSITGRTHTTTHHLLSHTPTQGQFSVCSRS